MFERTLFVVCVKTGGSKSLSHTGWSGGRGYLRRGMRRKDERVESVRVSRVLKISERRQYLDTH